MLGRMSNWVFLALLCWALILRVVMLWWPERRWTVACKNADRFYRSLFHERTPWPFPRYLGVKFKARMVWNVDMSWSLTVSNIKAYVNEYRVILNNILLRIIYGSVWPTKLVKAVVETTLENCVVKIKRHKLDPVNVSSCPWSVGLWNRIETLAVDWAQNKDNFLDRTLPFMTALVGSSITMGMRIWLGVEGTLGFHNEWRK